MALHQLPKSFHPDFSNPRKKPIGPVKVDWSNPLTRGLVAAWTCDEAGLLRDISGNGHHGTPTGTAGYYGSTRGRALDLTGTDYYTITDRAAFDFAGGAMSVVAGTISDSAGQNAELVEKQAGGLRYYQLFDATGSVWKWFVRGTGATIQLTGGTSVTGEYVNLCATASSSGAVLYENGVQTASNGSDPGDLSNSADLYLGFGNAGTYDGKVYYVWMYDRQLSDLEAQQLHESPYQILKPVEPSLYFTTEAGAAPTVVALTGQESTSGQGALTATGAARVDLGGLRDDVEQGELGFTWAWTEALTGQQSTSGQGTLGISIAPTVVTLTGQQSTSGQGALTATGAASVALTGQQSTSGQGALDVNAGEIIVSLGGQQSTSGQGSLGFGIGAVVGLSGQETIVRRGVVRIAGDIYVRTMTEWIFSQPGLSGTNADRWDQYLTLEGFAEGQINDRLYKWYGSQGYTGVMQKRINDWSEVNLFTDAPL